MPGNIAASAPATVLPEIVCAQFSRSDDYPTLLNEYTDGTVQLSAQTTLSRKSWAFAGRLTETERDTLLSFYLARHGSLQPFYFYDPFVTGSIYDPTGSSTTGRYTVRFSSPWSDALTGRRFDIDSLSLVEVA